MAVHVSQITEKLSNSSVSAQLITLELTVNKEFRVNWLVIGPLMVTVITLRHFAESKLYIIPEFAGKSFLEFTRIQSFSQISIKIEFKPMETEGLLLYNGEDEKTKGDFISLAMVNGHVEFRFGWKKIRNSADKYWCEDF